MAIFFRSKLNFYKHSVCLLQHKQYLKFYIMSNSSETWYVCCWPSLCLSVDGFYIIFNSISVISGQYEGNNERLGDMGPHLQLENCA